MSKTFRDQLKEIRPSVKATRKSPVYKSSLPPSSNVWAKDGYDHINISRQSKVFLGHVLDLDYVRTWEHPVLGSFRTVSNLWHFLKARHKNDILRNAPIKDIRYVVTKQCGGYHQNVQNFRYMVLDGMYKRILSFKDIKQALIDSDLPFDSYRENDLGVRIRFENANWVCEGYTEIRKALKEGRAADFTHITPLSGKASDLYNNLLAELTKHPEVPAQAVVLSTPKIESIDPVAPSEPSVEEVEDPPSPVDMDTPDTDVAMVAEETQKVEEMYREEDVDPEVKVIAEDAEKQQVEIMEVDDSDISPYLDANSSH